MALSTDDVRHVARLARLALTDDEVESLRGQLSDILAYAEKVGEVAAGDVPPTSHAYPLANVLRADEPRPSLPPDEALSTAPRPVDGRFQVPRIVGEEAAQRPTVGGDLTGEE
ncbi:MAG: Asp-tRNA(Asn)/Glu-tRNA(Gln) amidotransferase subunit GatC [Egibacteraceae bacterium]